MSGSFTPQWWSMKIRARCEMTVWIKAETSQQANAMYENGDYDEASPWEPVGPATVGRALPALDFEPTRDNP
jgi:hypothetical protein